MIYGGDGRNYQPVILSVAAGEVEESNDEILRFRFAPLRTTAMCEDLQSHRNHNVRGIMMVMC